MTFCLMTVCEVAMSVVSLSCGERGFSSFPTIARARRQMMVEEERPLGGQMVEEEAEYEEPSAEAMAQYGDGLAQVGLSTQQRCDPLVPTSTG